MSKKHFVLTGIVLTALSVGVASAAPINIVQTGHNIGAEGTTFTNDGNITLGHAAGAANSTHQVINSPNSNGNNIAIGTLSSNGSKGGANITLGGKTFLNGTGDNNVIAGSLTPIMRKRPCPSSWVPNRARNPKVLKTYGSVITKGRIARLTIPSSLALVLR